ncbi:MAG: uridine kinase [Bacteroidia bacterium]|nr:uridine kinase [Bacteroidia bacterium]
MTVQKNCYFVGITGGSASGKTHLLNAILKAFEPGTVTLVSQDNYYKDRELQVPDENGEINFDHPNALDLDLFVQHIQQLFHLKPVTIREYTFNNPNKIPKLITYEPAPIVIVEGLFVFHRPELNPYYNLKIFVDAEEHIKLTRRIQRDHHERGYSIESILHQYQSNVVPMYRRYVEPTKWDCDLILPNNKHIDRAVEVVVNHLLSKVSSVTV